MEDAKSVVSAAHRIPCDTATLTEDIHHINKSHTNKETIIIIGMNVNIMMMEMDIQRDTIMDMGINKMTGDIMTMDINKNMDWSSGGPLWEFNMVCFKTKFSSYFNWNEFKFCH